MSLTRFKLGHFGLAAAAAFAMSTAAAAPVNSWEYSVNSVFLTDAVSTTFGPSSGPGGVGGGTTIATSSEISWGAAGGTVGTGPGTNRSALRISNSPASGTVAGGTDLQLGELGKANMYSHINNTRLPFADPTVLKTTVIRAEITLTSALGVIGPVTASYDVKFRETINNPASGTCPTGSTPCPDLFVLDGSTNFGFNGGDGYFYSVTFTSVPALGLLGGAADNVEACKAAGAPTGCVGYVTAENAVTNVQFYVQINATPIPEPTSIALLGAGLLGMVGIRRRQQKNKA